jgi:hypothetical protein
MSLSRTGAPRNPTHVATCRNCGTNSHPPANSPRYASESSSNPRSGRVYPMRPQTGLKATKSPDAPQVQALPRPTYHRGNNARPARNQTPGHVVTRQRRHHSSPERTRRPQPGQGSRRPTLQITIKIHYTTATKPSARTTLPLLRAQSN